ncbi:MAG: hypothetical protein GC154_03815 [bacterium]|nr:hypothetical protein [bacterium]
MSKNARTHHTCTYVCADDGYSCSRTIWSAAKDGLCLGHSHSSEKPKAEFIQFISARFRERDFDFDGFVFPYRLSLKKTTLPKAASFAGCVFRQGLRFENVHFGGGYLRFDGCVVEGGDVVFDRCVFSASRVSFLNSIIHAGSIEFRNCLFKGDRADFSHIDWNASRRIVFVGCHFQSSSTVFTQSSIKAPVASFFASSFSSEQTCFERMHVQAKRFSLKKSRQPAGEWEIAECRFECGLFDASESEWRGDRVQFKKTVWNSERFLMERFTAHTAEVAFDRCQWDGEWASFAHSSIHKGSFLIHDSRLNARQRVDFSKIKADGRFLIHDNRFESRHVSLEGLESIGEEYVFQQNDVFATTFSHNEALIEAKRATLNRTRIEAEIIDFSRSRFENTQASFQAMRCYGETLNFQNALFAGRRASFNLSKFNMRRVQFDRATFGSGVATFWRTDFGMAAVTFHGASDRGAIVHFGGDLARVRFERAELRRCNFHDSQWEETGWMKVKRIADEPALLRRNDHNELRRIYQWIAQQYARSGDKIRRNDFLYAARETERLQKIAQHEISSAMWLGFQRWTTGYGLGFARVGLLKGAVAVFAAFIPLFTRIR